ncbi:hypothetical protein VTJ49DRAFT_1071 [Mycothermus thermophilus]|uniref:Nucleotide exchange factor SIL1 n=1 Tax=Humicola insolens TaxID=85995 RepID=A0ABR3VDD4_HUMIN
MAKIRLKTLPISLVALIGLMAWGSSASSSDSSSSASPSESPSAEVELICHTDNPADCYPKVFQPTDEFQVVHPDQDLPPGLHVRLNINTGLREAKINVPDEHRPDLEGLPVDSSVVVVEPNPPSADDQPKIPPNAPAYDPAGKIKEPKSAGTGEASAFYKSLTILKKGLDVDGALEMLEEISHDIYYGLKIAEDYDTVHELFCLSTTPSTTTSNDGSDNDEATLRRARLASLTLASTVQNHPKALREIEGHWPQLSSSLCPASNRSPRTTTLGAAIFSLLPPADASDLPNPSLTKIRVALLTGLLKSPTLRAQFLAASPTGGAAHILRILTSPTPSSLSEDDAAAWAGTQRRAAQLLTDTFLDADMGAALGEWPSSSKAQLSAKECAVLHEAGDAGHGREECLDWHVERLRKEFKKDDDHWSHEFGKKLAEARKSKKPLKPKKKKGQGKEEL